MIAFSRISLLWKDDVKLWHQRWYHCQFAPVM